MRIKRRSTISGVVRVLELPITPQQLQQYELGEGLIQNIFPNLTPSQREFIISGITQDEWQDLFTDEPELN